MLKFTPQWLANPHNAQTVRFADFHSRNPNIYKELERRANTLFTLGQTRIGISLLVESLRYDLAIAGNRSVEINNSHRSMYARLLRINNPHLRPAVRIRSAPTLGETGE